MNTDYSNQIKVKLIAHSRSAITGKEILTWELEYPRMVHCFDKETEVLSKINDETAKFRSFEEVAALGCLVAQYKPSSGVIEFVQPTSNIAQKGTHDMVSFDKKKLSMCVTAGHRVYTDKRTTGNAFLKDTLLAKDLLGAYGTRRIPQAGWAFEEEVLTPEEIQLIVWFVADGHEENRNTVSFHFRKQRKIAKVKELLLKCNITFKEFTYETSTVIRFDSPWWVSSCYNEEGSKKLPKQATQMSQGTYELFKQALFESDGCLANEEYNTSSTELAEQVQVIALLHGDATNLRRYGSGMYKQKFMQNNYITIRADKDKFTSSKMDTTVYCVSVPSSYIVVRRKGVAYVSGNCELMTHRLFSRNAASSRAIPIERMIEMVETNPAMPIHWGKNQAGMQAKEAFEGLDEIPAREAWIAASKEAIKSAKTLNKLGLHKQICNRILEPFSHIKVVLTSTEFENWYWLRDHEDAQPEIAELVRQMRELHSESEAIELHEGEWHLPYVKAMRMPVGNGWEGQLVYTTNYKEFFDKDKTATWTSLPLKEAQMISASCCAQVSYRRLDDTFEKAKLVYDRLVESKPVHGSPLEHQATPIPTDRVDGCYYEATSAGWPEGVTHLHKEQGLGSGNLYGWIQYRQLIKNTTKW